MFNPKMRNMAVWAVRIAEFGPIRKRRMQRSFRKQGAVLVEKIKEATPVRKGDLRNSIRMIDAPKMPGVLIIAGGTPETARGPNLDEALLTEYGTKNEAAEPFFYPTIQGEQSDLKDGIADDTRNDTGN